MVLELGILILIAATFALLAPRMGLFAGPVLIVLGIAPLVVLFLLPAGLQARANEHYGMLSTIAFLVLTPTGVVLAAVSFLANRD